MYIRSFTESGADKMGKDAELDRLKAAQDQAFRRKQDAQCQVQQRAWEKRSSARDAMNRVRGQRPCLQRAAVGMAGLLNRAQIIQ